MCRIIKTDMELKQDMVMLEKRYDIARIECDKLKSIIDDMYNVWRSVKDPLVKREIHKEIYKLNDTLMRMEYKTDGYYTEYLHVWRILNSKPTPTYGCIYDTYQELDYDTISIYGLRGVKL